MKDIPAQSTSDWWQNWSPNINHTVGQVHWAQQPLVHLR